MSVIVHGDCFKHLPDLPSGSVPLIYVDPPFNTGKRQTYTRLKTSRSAEGDRTGFGGNRYSTVEQGTTGYDDRHADYIGGFLRPLVEQCHRLLTDTGSFFLHLDFREVHYAKVMCDEVFGRESFKNEIIWAYDFGGRSKKRWPAKHDNILWYAKDPGHYTFNYDAIDRIPYMAPGLAGPEKAARGKVPTDTWWMTIVPTNGKERTGYATQKPLRLLRRIVAVHSAPGDLVLDPCAGSGTTGEACAEQGRTFVLLDNNEQAVQVMRERLKPFAPRFIDLSEGATNTLDNVLLT